MQVHRPGRISFSTVRSQPGAKGPASWKTDELLPREPSLTTVEVMREAESFAASLLTEPADETMAGVLASTQALSESICAFAGTLLELRAARSLLVDQPVEQWRQKSVMPRRAAVRFAGYGGHAASLDQAKALQANESVLVRMQAAAVLDEGGRSCWPDWLARSEAARPSPGDRELRRRGRRRR